MSKKLPAVVQRRKREENEKSVRVVVTPSMPMPGSVPPPASSPAESPPWSGEVNGKSPAYQEQSHPGAAPSSAHIMLEQQGRVTTDIRLHQQMFTIGRHSSCNIRVINQRVSRLHARLYQDNGVWVIEDADSVNGIAYQGQRVRRVVLKQGDRVYLAPDVALIFAYQ
jgi:pSer/pThr/pTyr-binding forkhead associated (FHA) protein